MLILFCQFIYRNLNSKKINKEQFYHKTILQIIINYKFESLLYNDQIEMDPS